MAAVNVKSAAAENVSFLIVEELSRLLLDTDIVVIIELQNPGLRMSSF